MATGISYFPCMEDELSYYKNLSMELELRLYDANVMLKENESKTRLLDEELEREIEQTERAYTELKTRMIQMQMEADDWKHKYYSSAVQKSSTVSSRIWVRYGSGRAVSFRLQDLEAGQVTILDDLIGHIRPRIKALQNIKDDRIKLRRQSCDTDLPEDTPVEALQNCKDDALVVTVGV